MTEPPATRPDQPTADTAPRSPDRWFAGLVALVLAILGAALPAGPAGSALAGLRSDARQAETTAPARTAILPSDRSEQAAEPAGRDRGPDPVTELPARSLAARVHGASLDIPAVVADIPRQAVRTGPRQPTGPPIPV